MGILRNHFDRVGNDVCTGGGKQPAEWRWRALMAVVLFSLPLAVSGQDQAVNGGTVQEGQEAVANGEGVEGFVPMPWPAMKKELVCHIATGENNPRNSEGAFIRLANGDILHIYTHYTGSSTDDTAPAHLAVRRSKDDGRTWSERDEREFPQEGVFNDMSVSLLRLQDDSIALFYLVNDTPTDSRLFMRISTDECKTWSDRIVCSDIPEYNVVNNDRVVQLTTGKPGRIIAPTSTHKTAGTDYLASFEEFGRIFMDISDDGGATWWRTPYLANPDNVVYQEPGLCELADGRLLMFIRTDKYWQYICYSSDAGETWTETKPSKLDSPMSPSLIKRIPGDDRLLAVWNPIIPQALQCHSRAGMCIAVLSPDGSEILKRKTLEYPTLLEKRQDNWQYPAILWLNDKEFLLAYFYWTRGTYIFRMNIDDLLND